MRRKIKKNLSIFLVIFMMITMMPITVFAAGESMGWSATTFEEALANDGSIATVVTVTLTNETFVVPGGAMTATTHYTVANVPAGLTAVVTGTSGTTATIALTGNATNHASANNVANLTVTFLDAAFTGGSAAAVTDSSKNDLAITFQDPATYAVTVADVVDGTATVTRDKATAAAGETVTVNIASIQAGKQFVSIAVAGVSGPVATVAVTPGEQYTFTMPSEIVTVTVTLQNIPNHVINITTANTLLVGNYAFTLNNANYNLNNYLIAAQTAYNSGGAGPAAEYNIYYYTGTSWYNLVTDSTLSTPIANLNTINGNGMYTHTNMTAN